MRRDAYEILGVERGADERAMKKAFRVVARELHPDVNSEDPEAETKFKEAAEAYEVLSDPERKAVYDRHGWDGVDSKGYASQAQGFGSFADIFERSSAATPSAAAAAARAPFRAGTSGSRWRSRSWTPPPASRWTCPTTPWSRVSTATATAPSPARPSRPATAAAAPASCARQQHRLGQLVRAQACDVCGGEGKVAQTPCGECAGRGRRPAAGRCRRPPGRHRRRPARSPDRQGPRRQRGGPAATCTSASP